VLKVASKGTPVMVISKCCIVNLHHIAHNLLESSFQVFRDFVKAVKQKLQKRVLVITFHWQRKTLFYMKQVLMVTSSTSGDNNSRTVSVGTETCALWSVSFQGQRSRSNVTKM